MKKVFVCAGMHLPDNKVMIEHAREVGRLLGEKGLIYVQGGSNQGLMGETLDEFLKYSKTVEFLIPKAYYDHDAPILENIVGSKDFNAVRVDGEAERLKIIKNCDMIIVLPGGTGTLEELLYVNETGRSNEHEAEIFVVNSEGFYNGFLEQIKTNIKTGFSKKTALHFEFVKNPSEITFNI